MLDKNALLTLILLIFLLGGGALLKAQRNGLCFECHDDPELIDNAGDSLYVDPDRWASSIHRQMEAECVTCHQDLAGFEDWPHPEKLEKVDCSMCHDKAVNEWELSVHGLPAREKGDLDAASCIDCHGSHYILPADDPGSRLYPANLPHTCLGCHSDLKLEAKHEGMGKVGKAKLYLESVHGLALEKNGLIISAICSSCHGSHHVLALDELLPRIPMICGKCHAGILEDYIQGVHGEAYLEGNKDVPLCTDCHGEHNILAPEDPESTVNPQAVGRSCSRCHDDMVLGQKYGLPLGRLEGYLNSYHGVALKFGQLQVASCASCHDFHNIRPSSDPESTIHPDNLHRTCGHCHRGAGENFADGKVHMQGRREDNFGAWLVKKAYLVLIMGLVCGFLAYISLDLYSHYQRKKRKIQQRSPQEED